MLLPVALKVERMGRNGYLAIVSQLQARIESGLIAPGAFLPTERELQEEFGAGRSTIRKVLATLVDQGWAQSVPKKGVVAGRGLRPVLSRKIALVENGSYVQQVLGERFRAMLAAQGFELCRVGGVPEYPLEYALQQVLDGDYAGALVWCFHNFPDQDLIARLVRQVPVVALDHRLGVADTDLVTFDNERAAYEATEQLIRSGAKRIGITGMFDTLEMTQLRLRGYMRALADHQRVGDPENFLFTMASGMYEPQTGRLEERLRTAHRPDALLVLQDTCFPSTVAAALRAGLSLPQDLKLATIGDDLSVTVDGVGMTAVAFDWESLAQEAFQLLMERLNDLHLQPQVRTVPHHLVVRGSCGTPVGDWTPHPEELTGFRGHLPIPRASYSFDSRWSMTASEIPAIVGAIQ